MRTHLLKYLTSLVPYLKKTINLRTDEGDKSIRISWPQSGDPSSLHILLKCQMDFADPMDGAEIARFKKISYYLLVIEK